MKLISLTIALLLLASVAGAEEPENWISVMRHNGTEYEDIEIKSITITYSPSEDDGDGDELCMLIAKRKHIEALRDAANAIVSFGKLWGLNDVFIEESRVAWNETQRIEKAEVCQ